MLQREFQNIFLKLQNQQRIIMRKKSFWFDSLRGCVSARASGSFGYLNGQKNLSTFSIVVHFFLGFNVNFLFVLTENN